MLSREEKVVGLKPFREYRIFEVTGLNDAGEKKSVMSGFTNSSNGRAPKCCTKEIYGHFQDSILLKRDFLPS